MDDVVVCFGDYGIHADVMGISVDVVNQLEIIGNAYFAGMAAG